MKNLLLGLVLLCTVFAFGNDKEFTLTPTVVANVVKVGEPVKIKIAYKCPEGYTAKAWRLVAYVPNIPSNFAEVTGNKVIPHKMKEWSSVFIMNWDWKVPADNILVKDTAKWPAGDYRMALYVLFQAKDKDNKVITKMINENILFTLKK